MVITETEKQLLKENDDLKKQLIAYKMAYRSILAKLKFYRGET